MLNNIPIIGWLLDIVFKISLSIPFWIAWTLCGLGKKFFGFLPEVYQAPGFWNIVGVFVIIGILKSFSPFSVHSTATAGDKK